MEHQEPIYPYLTRCVEQRTSESVFELEARLEIEKQRASFELREKELEARLRRFIEKVKVLAFMLGVLFITGVCLYVTFSSRFPQEEKKTASSIIQSVVMGVVGYLVGKSSKKPESG